MLDIGLDIPVSAELHGILQINIRIVLYLCQTSLSGLMVDATWALECSPEYMEESIEF